MPGALVQTNHSPYLGRGVTLHAQGRERRVASALGQLPTRCIADQPVVVIARFGKAEENLQEAMHVR